MQKINMGGGFEKMVQMFPSTAVPKCCKDDDDGQDDCQTSVGAGIMKKKGSLEKFWDFLVVNFDIAGTLRSSNNPAWDFLSHNFSFVFSFQCPSWGSGLSPCLGLQPLIFHGFSGCPAKFRNKF